MKTSRSSFPVDLAKIMVGIRDISGVLPEYRTKPTEYSETEEVNVSSPYGRPVTGSPQPVRCFADPAHHMSARSVRYRLLRHISAALADAMSEENKACREIAKDHPKLVAEMNARMYDTIGFPVIDGIPTWEA